MDPVQKIEQAPDEEGQDPVCGIGAGEDEEVRAVELPAAVRDWLQSERQKGEQRHLGRLMLVMVGGGSWKLEVGSWK